MAEVQGNSALVARITAKLHAREWSFGSEWAGLEFGTKLWSRCEGCMRRMFEV
jgi:hypothetical protein